MMLLIFSFKNKMRLISFILLYIPLFSFFESCSTSKTVRQCPELPKQYSKELDLKVRASVDSAFKLPSPNIELGLKRNVIKLAESTREETIQYFLYNICVISNNKGFSKDTTAKLLSQTLETYKAIRLKSISSIPKTDINVNQTNNGTINGAMIGVLNVSEKSIINKEIEIVATKDSNELLISINPTYGSWNFPMITVPTEFVNEELFGVYTGLSMALQFYKNRDTIRSETEVIPCISYAIQFNCSKSNPIKFKASKNLSIFSVADRLNEEQHFFIFRENDRFFYKYHNEELRMIQN